jgi:predicted nucleic acid-binding protein
MRLLLDTNVLFSALGFRGTVGWLLEVIVHQGHTLVTSEYLLDELRQKIREKFQGDQKEAALDLLLFILSRIPLDVKKAGQYRQNLPRALEVVPEQDAPILALALLEDVDYLVTGDKHFLESEEVKALLGERLKSPREMLTLLGDCDL